MQMLKTRSILLKHFINRSAINLDDKTSSIFKRSLFEQGSVKGYGKVWLLVVLAIFQPYERNLDQIVGTLG